MSKTLFKSNISFRYGENFKNGDLVDGRTGLVVPSKNPHMLANAIEKLLLNKELRNKMGKAGRDRVKKLYHIENNLDQMIKVYGLKRMLELACGD